MHGVPHAGDDVMAMSSWSSPGQFLTPQPSPTAHNMAFGLFKPPHLLLPGCPGLLRSKISWIGMFVIGLIILQTATLQFHGGAYLHVQASRDGKPPLFC